MRFVSALPLVFSVGADQEIVTEPEFVVDADPEELEPLELWLPEPALPVPLVPVLAVVPVLVVVPAVDPVVTTLPVLPVDPTTLVPDFDVLEMPLFPALCTDVAMLLAGAIEATVGVFVLAGSAVLELTAPTVEGEAAALIVDVADVEGETVVRSPGMDAELSDADALGSVSGSREIAPTTATEVG